MRKITFLFLIFISCASTLFAQPVNMGSLRDIQHFLSKEKMLEGNSGVQGSPYLNADFKQGEVISTSNTVAKDIPLRYNIFDDEIEFQSNDKKVFLIEKSTVKSIKIGDSEFVYKAYSQNNKLNRSFFEILVQGKATLLKQYHIIFEEEQLPKAYEAAVPAQFKPKKADFYIAFDDAEAKRFVGIKDLIELLPDKKTELAEFIKKNKLKVGDQEDIVKAIQFYNE